MKLTKEMLLLYGISDRAWVGRQTLYEQIEAALLGGATLIQLREKHMDQTALIAETRELAGLCHRYGVPLIVNDDAAAAAAGGADGVHVGAEDCPVAELRQRFGPELIIGATAKTVAQARAAEAAGADYLGVGAVFPSPTKSQALRITPEQLREICGSVSIPAVAIGGISADNLPRLAGCGMAGVAVVSALFGAEDVTAAARRLKELALSVTTA
ncbi:MAG: thiamine phosphate synthase [Firmicutes bacterium]|nr:thiamine phosphate synthase [Bacillota bacterium]